MSIKVCPSCGGVDVKIEGNQLHCNPCDVTFEITDGGATVVNLDPLGADRKRLDTLEQEIEDLKGKTNDQGKEVKTDEEGTTDEGFIEIDFIDGPDGEDEPDVADEDSGAAAG